MQETGVAIKMKVSSLKNPMNPKKPLLIDECVIYSISNSDRFLFIYKRSKG